MIVTALTEMFALQHPIVLGPMGGVSGRHLAAARGGNYDTAVVWAGEAVDLIKSVEGAAALVARISADAEAQLRTGARLAR